MNHSNALSSNTRILNKRLVVAATSLVLALVMLAGVGFVQGSNGAVHNAAHDTRHSMAFPCH